MMTVAAGAKLQAPPGPDGLMPGTDASSKLAHLALASAAPSNAAAAPTAAQPEPQGECPSALAPSLLVEVGPQLPELLALSRLLCSMLGAKSHAASFSIADL